MTNLDGFLADLNNLLDGTAKVAIRTFSESEWAPAPDSQADKERRQGMELVGRRGHVWGPEPALTAHTIAGMSTFAAADHLGGMSELIKPPMPVFGTFVLARATTEAAARSWWLFDPALDVRERVNRSLRERWANVGSSLRILTEMGARDEDLERAERRRQDVLDQADRLGVPVDRDEHRAPIAVAVGRPASGRVVADLLAVVGFERGAGVYDFLSSIEHASASGLMHFFRIVRDDPEGLVASGAPELDPFLLRDIVHLALLAFILSFDRLVGFYGWTDASWPSWRLHVYRKVLEERERPEDRPERR